MEFISQGKHHERRMVAVGGKYIPGFLHKESVQPGRETLQEAVICRHFLSEQTAGIEHQWPRKGEARPKNG